MQTDKQTMSQRKTMTNFSDSCRDSLDSLLSSYLDSSDSLNEECSSGDQDGNIFSSPDHCCAQPMTCPCCGGGVCVYS